MNEYIKLDDTTLQVVTPTTQQYSVSELLMRKQGIEAQIASWTQQLSDINFLIAKCEDVGIITE